MAERYEEVSDELLSAAFGAAARLSSGPDHPALLESWARGHEIAAELLEAMLEERMMPAELRARVPEPFTACLPRFVAPGG